MPAMRFLQRHSVLPGGHFRRGFGMTRDKKKGSTRNRAEPDEKAEAKSKVVAEAREEDTPSANGS
ncbi:hypothetical protein [Devosia geojensis]|uniref:hypothetical protein n=1 Tax=Devosia geojensis TaxID=443610 RepID=UPI000AFA2669|nr:hypothetical protein [Devosia geojensis]